MAHPRVARGVTHGEGRGELIGLRFENIVAQEGLAE
jgi:hypothetical protein